MSIVEIHARLSNTAALFVGILGLWALFLRFRNQSLEGGWLGAAVIGELLIIVQGLLGLYLYLQGLSSALPRPFLHILYGLVAIITLPAAYGYFGSLEDRRARTMGMALVCFFLWGILLRATQVAHYLPPGL
jgi:CDP-diglyceride synthetase